MTCKVNNLGKYINKIINLFKYNIVRYLSDFTIEMCYKSCNCKK